VVHDWPIARQLRSEIDLDRDATPDRIEIVDTGAPSRASLVLHAAAGGDQIILTWAITHQPRYLEQTSSLSSRAFGTRFRYSRKWLDPAGASGFRLQRLSSFSAFASKRRLTAYFNTRTLSLSSRRVQCYRKLTINWNKLRGAACSASRGPCARHSAPTELEPSGPPFSINMALLWSCKGPRPASCI